MCRASLKKNEKRHTTNNKKTKNQVPKLIKFVKTVDGSFQYYTYSPERHAYLATKQPSSANNTETDYRCVVSRFQYFKSDEETKEIFWTLFGTTVAFDSIPAVFVENVKYRKKWFLSPSLPKNIVKLSHTHSVTTGSCESRKRTLVLFVLRVCTQLTPVDHCTYSQPQPQAHRRGAILYCFVSLLTMLQCFKYHLQLANTLQQYFQHLS